MTVSDEILQRLENICNDGDSSEKCHNNYADIWNEVPVANLDPLDFGRIQWCRGKNFNQIPDTAMLHVALQPERNAKAIALFYDLVKDPDSGSILGGPTTYKPYNAQAAYLLSHFRNTMQYHFAAEICNYFLYHLDKGNIPWKDEPFVKDKKILERNYIPEKVFPQTLPLFGIPEKLSIKFQRIEQETKKDYIHDKNPNFYFIQQVSRFLGRNAERFMSGATIAYALTGGYKTNEETEFFEELLIEECKSFWGNATDQFKVRKEIVNGKEQCKVVSIKDEYGYDRVHIYAVDPIQEKSANPITTVSVVIAGSPSPTSGWNATKLWLKTNFGIWGGDEQIIAGEKVECHPGIFKMYKQLFYGDKSKPNERTIAKTIAEFINETNLKHEVEIRVSGHSLGGAVAQILALDFNINLSPRIRELYCITLHAPPVFKKVPQLKFPQKVQLIHFYHEYDPVVNTPKFLYYNAGIQVPLSSPMATLSAIPNITFHDYTKPFEWFNKVAITPYKTYFQPPPHLSGKLPADNTRVSPKLKTA